MHEFIGTESLLFFVILTLYMFSSAYLPFIKTGIAVLLGLLGGLIAKLATSQTVQFDEGPFFYFILPPIVFAAGYNMKRKRFFKNIGYITLFGIVGTVLSFLGNTYLAYGFNSGAGLGLSDKEVLVLGAALSATDTVAGLTIISEKEAPKLNSVLFGEGVINDAVAIILFKSIMQTSRISFLDSSALVFTFQVLENCGLSCLLGLAFGVVSALIFKVCEALANDSIHEISLLFFIANIAYITAEFLSLSGVITLLICAIVMAHYTWYNLSNKAKSGSSQSFQLVGEISESFVFVYLGLSTFAFVPEHWSLGFIFYMVGGVLFSRSIGILVLSGLWSIRGAIAFALVLSLGQDVGELVKTTVLGVVLFTTIAFGALMPVMKWMVSSPQEEPPNERYRLVSKDGELALIDPISTTQTDTQGPGPRRSWFHRSWRTLDDGVIKRMLIKPSSIESRNSLSPHHLIPARIELKERMETEF